MVTPSCLAVCKLIASSTLSTVSIFMSLGCAPLRTALNVLGREPADLTVVLAVTRECALSDHGLFLEHGRELFCFGRVDDELRLTADHWIREVKKNASASPVLSFCNALFSSSTELTCRSMSLMPIRFASSRAKVVALDGDAAGRIVKRQDSADFGQYLLENFQTFCREVAHEDNEPR